MFECIKNITFQGLNIYESKRKKKTNWKEDAQIVASYDKRGEHHFNLKGGTCLMLKR
jgi:hypothetical protein